MAEYEINKISFGDDVFKLVSGESENVIYYGNCSTAAATQQKEVSITGFPSSLAAGQKVIVNFANNQNYNGQPTLKINSLTAKGICRYGTTAAARYEWRAGQSVLLIYDGTNWLLQDGLANTTYFGKTKLSDSLTSTSTSLAASANAAKLLNDKIIGDWTLLTSLTTDGGGDYSTAITIPSGARELGFGYGDALAPSIMQVNYFSSFGNGWLGGITVRKYVVDLQKSAANKISRIAIRQFDGTVGDAANNSQFKILYR